MAAKPEWLKIGQLVKVAEWPGRIIDVTETETGKLMVLVESPKGVWRNHRPEWLEYIEGMIQPVEFADIVWLFDAYVKHIEGMLARAADMKQEWSGTAVKKGEQKNVK